MFVIETKSISKQIMECKFGAFLEVSDRLSTKLTVFYSMILQINFITILYIFRKHSG